MSFASKVTLAASAVATGGIIYYVLAKQNDDIKRMHEGVIRDKERQQRRMIQNVYNLEKQAELTKSLKSKIRDEEVELKLSAGKNEIKI